MVAVAYRRSSNAELFCDLNDKGICEIARPRPGSVVTVDQGQSTGFPRNLHLGSGIDNTRHQSLGINWNSCHAMGTDASQVGKQQVLGDLAGMHRLDTGGAEAVDSEFFQNFWRKFHIRPRYVHAGP